MTARRYPPQALLLYVALGVALGMIGWAVLIHDSGSSTSPPAAKAPPARSSK
jgi:hypothetical protein